MWQNLRLETFASLLESIVIFKIAFDSFFFPLYGYRLGFMFAPFIILKSYTNFRIFRLKKFRLQCARQTDILIHIQGKMLF